MEQFDSTPATYVDNESGILLRVGPGCLSEGQVAGPITVITDKRYIVKSGGSSFLGSALVDCQPSGAVFRKPLELEFSVAEDTEDVSGSDGEDAEYDEDLSGSDGEDEEDDEDLDGRDEEDEAVTENAQEDSASLRSNVSAESFTDKQGLQEHQTSLQNAHKVTCSWWRSRNFEFRANFEVCSPRQLTVLYETWCWGTKVKFNVIPAKHLFNCKLCPITCTPAQMFWRAEDSEPWTLQDGAAVVFDEERRKCAFRAHINHFCGGFLGKKLNLQCAFQTSVLWKSRELEFLNATDRRLMFLVLPTSYSNSALTSIALSLKAQGVDASLDVKRAVEKGLLQSAFDFQIIPVPAMSTTTTLQHGQECPFSTCTLPGGTGKKARVALVTVDGTFVHVWLKKIMNRGSELVILPPMFADPNGHATRRQLADSSDFELVRAAGMANQNPAVVQISSAGTSGGGTLAEPDEDETTESGE